MQLELFPRSIVKSRLPTNLTADHHPVHRWQNFIAGFSPEFVKSCIREAGIGRRETVIDPFAGLSTTLVQANFEGVRSIGFEAHPFFFDISQAKIDPPEDGSAIDEIREALIKVPLYDGELGDLWSESAVKFLKKLVNERDLRLLAGAFLLEKTIETQFRQIYRLIVSRALELASGSQTDGIYKAPTTRKRSTPYHQAVEQVCAEVHSDIEAVGGLYRRQAILYPTSSENMSAVADKSCSICVTSPPYLNNFDFAEMTRMELYFWKYAGSWREITEKVRRKLIVNTTTAPTDLKRAQGKFRTALSARMRASLDPLVEALRRERKTRRGKKDYYHLVYPYFGQMRLVFLELKRVLRPGSPFHLVVADSALYGVHIETHNLLANLMEETSFEVTEIDHLRKRGDRWILEKRQGAKKGLGEYLVTSKRI